MVVCMTSGIKGDQDGLASPVLIDSLDGYVTHRLKDPGSVQIPEELEPAHWNHAGRTSFEPIAETGQDVGNRNSLVRRRIVHPSVELRRQHAVRDGARVAQLKLRASRGALLRRDCKGRVHLPALERRGIIGRSQGRDVKVQCEDRCGLQEQRTCSQ